MIEKLEWDSGFFKLNVGKINETIENDAQLTVIETELAIADIDLAYYSSSTPLNNFKNINENYIPVLVDKKITYSKLLSDKTPFSENIYKYCYKYPEDKLMKLAIESGVYSRFNIDKKIGRKKYEEMYKLWIINSVNKSISKEVLVYLIDTNIGGFITLNEKNLKADIGLISVDKRFRGRGIGKALIYAAENWFSKHSSFDSIQVVTQNDNIPACKLYESCGYTPIKKEYFYHFWKNKS